MTLGDYPAARVLFHECLVIQRELGDRWGIGHSLNALGDVAAYQGDVPTARVLYEESLAIQRELGNRGGIAESLEGLAAVASALGRYLRAARIWGAAKRVRDEIGSPLSVSAQPTYDQRAAVARAALGNDASFNHAWEEGRAWTAEQAIDLAFEETPERG